MPEICLMNGGSNLEVVEKLAKRQLSDAICLDFLLFCLLVKFAEHFVSLVLESQDQGLSTLVVYL